MGKNQYLIDLYGTDNAVEILKAKTESKQIKAFVSKPKLVKMSEAQCRSLCKNIGLEYLDGYEGRILQYKITDETSDRHGDIVRANGGNFKDYMKNPVMLFAHQYHEFPIGNSLKVWKSNEQLAWNAYGLFFDSRVDGTGRSDIAFRFASSGAMPGCSIGFMADETRRREDEEGKKKFGIEYMKWSALEFSACSVPANPNALANSVKNIFTNDQLKAVGDDREFFSSVLTNDWIDLLVKEYETASSVVVISDIPNIETFDTDEHYEKAEAVKSEEVLKPYPNEHSARLIEPGDFDGDSFRRSPDGTIYGTKNVPATAAVIWGRLKGQKQVTPQAIRFPTKDWTASKAKKWLKDNEIKHIRFEQATKSVQTEDIIDDLHKRIDSLYTTVTEQNEKLKHITELLTEISGELAPNPPSDSGEQSVYNLADEILLR